MSGSLFSYVVRYDSGFAPNPFHNYCTLATCKPGIRRHAELNDWLVGTASNARNIERGGHLVYAMRVTEIIRTEEYWADPRFENKKPNLFHNWVNASGDNIYEPLADGKWRQLNSYHSQDNGAPNEEHVRRDTSVQRILISDDYVYFGGEGPRLPAQFLKDGEAELLCLGQNYKRVKVRDTIVEFENWIRSLAVRGYQGMPWDWVQRRK